MAFEKKPHHDRPIWIMQAEGALNREVEANRRVKHIRDHYAKEKFCHITEVSPTICGAMLAHGDKFKGVPIVVSDGVTHLRGQGAILLTNATTERKVN